MTEETNAVTTENTESVQDEQVQPVQEKEDYIPRSEFKKVLNDMHKHKSRAKGLEDQLRLREEQELKQREEWQKLSDHYEGKYKESQEKLNSYQQIFVKDKKINAVQQEAVKAGLRQEALSDLDILDLDDVIIETTSTGRYNVLGADKFVSRLKVNRPHWFGRSNSSINSNDPEVVNAGKVTYEQIMKASKKAEETGRYDEYQALLSKYKQQN